MGQVEVKPVEVRQGSIWAQALLADYELIPSETPILFFTLHSLANPRKEGRDRRKFFAVLILYSTALLPAPFTILFLLDVLSSEFSTMLSSLLLL